MLSLSPGEGEGLGKAFDLSGRGRAFPGVRGRPSSCIPPNQTPGLCVTKRTVVLLRPHGPYPPIRGQREQRETVNLRFEN